MSNLASSSLFALMQPDASCSGQKRKSSEATAPGKVGLDAKQKVCEFKVSIKQIDYYTTKVSHPVQ